MTLLHYRVHFSHLSLIEKKKTPLEDLGPILIGRINSHIALLSCRKNSDTRIMLYDVWVASLTTVCSTGDFFLFFSFEHMCSNTMKLYTDLVYTRTKL